MIEAGKSVVITAAASGIGRAIAEAFLAQGCRVFVCDINQSALEEFAAAHPQLKTYACDVSSPPDVDGFFDALAGELDAIDVFINNAGIGGPVANLEDVEPADWDRTVAIDLSSVFYCSRRAIPMMASPGGCIINLSSTAALFTCPSRAPYVASKWGVIGLTKTMAAELGPRGIRVNVICPGSVEGDRIDRVIARSASLQDKSEKEVRDLLSAESSLGRMMKPEEIANTALYLASDLASGVSGQVLAVDGNTV